MSESHNIGATNKHLVNLTMVLFSCECSLVPNTQRWKARVTRPSMNLIWPVIVCIPHIHVSLWGHWCNRRLLLWLYDMKRHRTHWYGLNAQLSADDVKLSQTWVEHKQFVFQSPLYQAPYLQRHMSDAVVFRPLYGLTPNRECFRSREPCLPDFVDLLWLCLVHHFSFIFVLLPWVSRLHS